jgi:dTDP-4-amino-4,6-dideoxygalactose transaminase/ribosomal protein S18 acetylase RimI-like enzyme
MIIRRMEAGDLRDVVNTHLQAFPRFFLSELGPRFLQQFYRAIVLDESGVAIVATENGSVIGFVAGTIEPTGFYRRLLRRRFIRIAGSLLPPLFGSPKILVAVARRALRRTTGANTSGGAELMSLAVAPEYQRRGIARALVSSFLQATGRKGSSGVWLITDAVDNERVTLFYDRSGFERTRTFMNSEGRKLHEYTHRQRPFVPFARPDIGEEEIEAVRDVLESGWLTTGERVHEFERQFAAAVGAKHAVALSSGTAALHLALDAIGLQAGDEVIVPDYTFTATAEVVLYFGAKPIIVDVDRRTLNIDPAGVERGITSRTKAIIPVHFGGLPADLDAINGIAQTHGIAVIEDAAHAFPARYRGRSIGQTDQIACFSFYATKTITTGEGGMLCTNSDPYAERARLMSLHGISRDAWKRYRAEGSWSYEVVAAGYKYNLTDIAGALGLAQLVKAEKMRHRRQQIAERYYASLRQDVFELPAYDAIVDHAWHLYALRLNLERLTIDRDRFIEELRRAGVGASVHFIPLHMHPFYRDALNLAEDSFPVSLAQYRREISLPIYSAMTDKDVDTVIDAVLNVAKRFNA